MTLIGYQRVGWVEQRETHRIADCSGLIKTDSPIG
jgi:hypothetical protein